MVRESNPSAAPAAAGSSGAAVVVSPPKNAAARIGGALVPSPPRSGRQPAEQQQQRNRSSTPPREPTVVVNSGRVMHSFKVHVGSNAVARNKRLSQKSPRVQDSARKEFDARQESSRRKLAYDYAARVSPRYLDNVGGSTSPPPAGSDDDHQQFCEDGGSYYTPQLNNNNNNNNNGGDHDAADDGRVGGDFPPLGGINKRPMASNVVRETDKQTVILGGDLRTAGRHVVSLGSKRLNALAAIIASNPLLKHTGHSPRMAVIAPSVTTSSHHHVAPLGSTASGVHHGGLARGLPGVSQQHQQQSPPLTSGGDSGALCAGSSVAFSAKPGTPRAHQKRGGTDHTASSS